MFKGRLAASSTSRSSSASTTACIWTRSRAVCSVFRTNCDSNHRYFSSTSSGNDKDHPVWLPGNSLSGHGVSDKASYNNTTSSSSLQEQPPGSRAFVDCDRNALHDLFYKFAKECSVSGKSLDRSGLAKLLKAVGETVDPDTLEQLFVASDLDFFASVLSDFSFKTRQTFSPYWGSSLATRHCRRSSVLALPLGVSTKTNGRQTSFTKSGLPASRA